MKYLILQSADTQNCGEVYIHFSIFLFSIFVLAVLEILLVVIPKNVPGEVKDCAGDHLTKINYLVVWLLVLCAAHFKITQIWSRNACQTTSWYRTHLLLDGKTHVEVDSQGGLNVFRSFRFTNMLWLKINSQMYLVIVVFQLSILLDSRRGEEVKEGVGLHLQPCQLSFDGGQPFNLILKLTSLVIFLGETPLLPFLPLMVFTFRIN